MVTDIAELLQIQTRQNDTSQVVVGEKLTFNPLLTQ